MNHDQGENTGKDIRAIARGANDLDKYPDDIRFARRAEWTTMLRTNRRVHTISPSVGYAIVVCLIIVICSCLVYFGSRLFVS